MKNKLLITATVVAFFGVNSLNAQINLGDRALGAIANGIKGFTFSDEDAAKIAADAIVKMDKENPIADAKDPYTDRKSVV